MESLGVLMMHPMIPYLQEELDKRFRLFRYYDAANTKEFLSLHAPSIKAVVGNSIVGASAELIDALPNLEIVSTNSVGLDKVDLRKCRERGIKVTNTPDVLTDDVADLAIGLMICTLRHICASDRYVRKGLWRGLGEYKLTTKVGTFCSYSLILPLSSV